MCLRKQGGRGERPAASGSMWCESVGPDLTRSPRQASQHHPSRHLCRACAQQGLAGRPRDRKLDRAGQRPNETAAKERLGTSEKHRTHSLRTGGTESHKPNSAEGCCAHLCMHTAESTRIQQEAAFQQAAIAALGGHGKLTCGLKGRIAEHTSKRNLPKEKPRFPTLQNV